MTTTATAITPMDNSEINILMYHYLPDGKHYATEWIRKSPRPSKAQCDISTSPALDSGINMNIVQSMVHGYNKPLLHAELAYFDYDVVKTIEWKLGIGKTLKIVNLCDTVGCVNKAHLAVKQLNETEIKHIEKMEQELALKQKPKKKKETN